MRTTYSLINFEPEYNALSFSNKNGMHNITHNNNNNNTRVQPPLNPSPLGLSIRIPKKRTRSTSRNRKPLSKRRKLLNNNLMNENVKNVYKINLNSPEWIEPETPNNLSPGFVRRTNQRRTRRFR